MNFRRAFNAVSLKWLPLLFVYLCYTIFFPGNVEARQSQVVIPNLKASNSLRLGKGDSLKNLAKKIGYRDLKGDSIEIDSAKINQLVVRELEKQAQSFMPEDLNNTGPKGVLIQDKYFSSNSEFQKSNFSQLDFKLPKEKLKEAQQQLMDKKKNYQTVLDTRIKEFSKKRNSLSSFKFDDRIELGVFIILNANNVHNFEIHPQIGYALTKKSVVGTGPVFSFDGEPTFRGIFGFFSQEVFKNVDWISEYHFIFKRSNLENIFQSVNHMPFRTGIGSDIKILGKVYLRSGILLPFGINSLENATDFRKNISVKIGLVYKQINK